MAEFILASKSPRRKQLLSMLLETFVVIPPAVDESKEESEAPRSYVRRITRAKAEASAGEIPINAPQDLVILAADTIVVDGAEILGKPADEEDAVRMLSQLRGRTHRVMSGLVVYQLGKEETISEVVTTEVTLREMSDQEIEAYVAGGDPLDKAGAYAIQNDQYNPVSALKECFANVMGLPLCKLAAVLESNDLLYPGGISLKCQETFAYECPVFRSYIPEQKVKVDLSTGKK